MYTPRHWLAHRVSLTILVAALSLGLVRPVSAQPPSPDPGRRLAAGAFHTLGLSPDGTLWVVGSNSSGQLGTGNYTPYRTPQQVTAVSNIVAVAAGSAHSLALSASGTVYAFGANAYGQVDSSTLTRPTPVTVPLTDVVAIAAGDEFSMARRSNGDVYVWGRNQSGQLATGGTASVTSPQLMTTGAVGIGAGAKHTLVVKAD